MQCKVHNLDSNFPEHELQVKSCTAKGSRAITRQLQSYTVLLLLF